MVMMDVDSLHVQIAATVISPHQASCLPQVSFSKFEPLKLDEGGVRLGPSVTPMAASPRVAGFAMVRLGNQSSLRWVVHGMGY